MIVRTATVADIPTIRKMAYITWPVTYGEILSGSQLAYMLDLFYSDSALEAQVNGDHHFLLVHQENTVLGFAAFSPSADAGVNQLHKLYVLPEAQGSGAGKTLLQEVIQHSREAGAHALRLNVNRFNKARSFYEKQGFTIIAEKDISIGEGYYMNDYVMEIRL